MRNDSHLKDKGEEQRPETGQGGGSRGVDASGGQGPLEEMEEVMEEVPGLRPER